MTLVISPDPVPAAAGEVTMRWASATRYYKASAQQDLFGDWELLCIWGGLGSRRGGYRTYPMRGQEQALQALQREARKRARRGYLPIT